MPEYRKMSIHAEQETSLEGQRYELIDDDNWTVYLNL